MQQFATSASVCVCVYVCVCTSLGQCGTHMLACLCLCACLGVTAWLHACECECVCVRAAKERLAVSSLPPTANICSAQCCHVALWYTYTLIESNDPMLPALIMLDTHGSLCPDTHTHTHRHTHRPAHAQTVLWQDHYLYIRFTATIAEGLRFAP